MADLTDPYTRIKGSKGAKMRVVKKVEKVERKSHVGGSEQEASCREWVQLSDRTIFNLAARCH